MINPTRLISKTLGYFNYIESEDLEDIIKGVCLLFNYELSYNGKTEDTIKVMKQVFPINYLF